MSYSDANPSIHPKPTNQPIYIMQHISIPSVETYSIISESKIIILIQIPSPALIQKSMSQPLLLLSLLHHSYFQLTKLHQLALQHAPLLPGQNFGTLTPQGTYSISLYLFSYFIPLFLSVSYSYLPPQKSSHHNQSSPHPNI